jgi:hypothetical protein
VLEFDPNAARYQIDPDRLDLVEEFLKSPKGPHSSELQKVLNRLRWRGEPRRYCALVIEPGRLWMLGRLPAERNGSIERLVDKTFTSLADVEREVFCRRWEAVTERPLPKRLRDPTP